VTELRPHLTPESEPSARWRPARAGIINIWRYYDETFEFHNGRLLLRGPNGTGKSKALEVLLPFLLDASLRSNRLSTFGSTDRTMHWNLMGDGYSGTTRVGYVWLQLDDADRAFTCGARLQASSHTTTVTPTYFTTTQRVGSSLLLLNDSAQPLSSSALEEAIGAAGQVHSTAASYRATVRQTLFPGLSEQRYDALITALLQLRTPKLSERLDPGLLSTLLSRALPPLAEAEIGEIAEGFERLDQQREQLRALDDEVAAADLVAGRQRTYARRVLRAGAATLISATSDLTALTRKARESDEAHADAVAAQKADATAQSVAETGAAALDARIGGLKQRDAYQSKGDLDDLQRQADRARSQSEQAQSRATKQQRHATQLRIDADAVRAAAEQLTAAAAAAESDARGAADRAGLGTLHQQLTDSDLQDARHLLRAALGGRRDRVRDVRSALAAHAAAVDRRTTAEAELDATSAELDAATASSNRCQQAYDSALADLTDRLADWARSCTELCTLDADVLISHAPVEVEVIDLIAAARQEVDDTLTRLETAKQADLAALQADRDRLTEQVRQLRDEADLPPSTPSTRTTDRSTMAGAPLWRLVAFRPETAPTVQAGVEAALETSGLLDAWIRPDGSISIDGHDIFADAPFIGPVAGRSLADVLVAEPAAPVSAHRISTLLSSIAFGATAGEQTMAVGADGTFQLAALHGSWTKPDAEHIGATARARARQRRIAELTAEIGALDTAIDAANAQLADIQGRRSALLAEIQRRPSYAEIRRLALDLGAADAALASAQSALHRCRVRLDAAQEATRHALRSLTAVASEHALPADPDGLATVENALLATESTGTLWLDQRAARDHALATTADKETTAKDAEEQAVDGAEAATGAQDEADRLAGKFEAINSTIGVELQQIMAEIATLRQRLSDLTSDINRLRDTQFRRQGQIGRLDNQRTVDAKAREQSVDIRDSAAARIRHLGSGTLLTDAALEVEIPSNDAVRTTLDAARRVASLLDSTPYAPSNVRDAEHRLSEALHETQGQLANRAELALEADDDIQIFVATMNGIRIGAGALREALQTERDRSQTDITAAERSLFDKTLTGDTRRHLAARIRQATEMVDLMNDRLERVRTASNVAVRLMWQVDPQLPSGTRAARELLLRDPIHLTESDREALHRFFRDRIDEARAADTARSWEQQLFEVFDYTAWHRFVVRLDRADGEGWVTLTKKLHGALSGGEKAIALHLPLFAAVAAHYHNTPAAPRFILLDEVFVGVDTANRGQVFALLASLDLDLVLTSDHEWCTYAEMDGIAIHQLITGSDGDAAVTTARFTWDGHDLTPDES
jgi:uncharacterized protein (TIGR02680 family)